MTGTLLAIVAISGLSAYAAAGVTDARPAALHQARTSCEQPPYALSPPAGTPQPSG